MDIKQAIKLANEKVKIIVNGGSFYVAQQYQENDQFTRITVDMDKHAVHSYAKIWRAVFVLKDVMGIKMHPEFQFDLRHSVEQMVNSYLNRS